MRPWATALKCRNGIASEATAAKTALMPCPICAQPDPVVFGQKEGRTLRICQVCRHIWFEEIPTEEESVSYYKSQYSENHLQEDIQESEAEYYSGHALELRDMIGRPMAIADIGCSIPVFLGEAGPHCRRRIGVDHSGQAHELGKSWGIEMLTPTQFVADVDDASLDVLRYSHVLEHLPDPVGTLRAHAKKLRPGGLLYITQPNLPVFHAIRTDLDLPDSVWPAHLHFFNPLSLLIMLERTNMEVFRFLTHGEARKSMQRYGNHIDFVTASDRLEWINEITVEYGMFTGWPFYVGRNSGCFCRKQYSYDAKRG